jgi:hypothetical protein
MNENNSKEKKVGHPIAVRQRVTETLRRLIPVVLLKYKIGFFTAIVKHTVLERILSDTIGISVNC